MKRVTKEEFVRRSNIAHNNKYDYSCSVFEGTQKMVNIMCPLHGEFVMKAANHLRGKGCKVCVGREVFDTQSFIKKARKIHGDKYDYSKVQYVRTNAKVIITCPIHGDFEQTPNGHLGGKRCKKCTQPHLCENTTDFINRANKVHDGKYTYSECDYINSTNKVTITCPVHGNFEQNPINHLLGQGCVECSKLINRWDLVNFYKEDRSGDELGVLYVVKIKHKETGESFFKVGITKRGVTQRYQHQKRDFDVELLDYIVLDNYNCAVLEKKILSDNKKIKYVPSVRFEGYTECFREQIDIHKYCKLVGFQELVKYYQVATNEQIEEIEKHIKNEDWEEFKSQIYSVLGVELQ